jgi:hypothetical protein
MKIYRNIIGLLLVALCLSSCTIICLNPDEKYQPLGTAVLTANGLLLVKYPQDRPESIQENEYKDLLKEDYKIIYNRLLPYLVQIKKDKLSNNFIVSVFDGQKLILTDWLCTEGRIDCWSYNGECYPDKIQINCDK